MFDAEPGRFSSSQLEKLIVHAVILALSFAIILAGSELFTNGVEWGGHKLAIAEAAVGSLLAAVGTALPETFVPAAALLTAGFLVLAVVLGRVRRELGRLSGQVAESAGRLADASARLAGEARELEAHVGRTEDNLSRL